MKELNWLRTHTGNYSLFFNNYIEPKEDFRYKLDNNYCRYFDGCIYFCMLNHFKPKRVIEVGCGNSSALLLDFDEYFSDCLEKIVFIDKQLREFRKIVPSDRMPPRKVELIEKPLENVRLNHFTELEENDILYIDSSHKVFKEKDVQKYIFDILPILNKGVIVHIHDIFYPWVYYKHHIGMGFNEMYLLKLFLEYNNNYKIIFWNSRVEELHRKELEEDYPLLLKTYAGGLWLKRV